MTDRVLPSNWGITTPEQLLSNLRVAENGGDMAECADAFEWMLRSGRLVDREAIDYEAAYDRLDAILARPEPVTVDTIMANLDSIIDAALGETDER